MQIASLVIEESGEARTNNLCQRCDNEKLVFQVKQSLKSKEWREVVERKAHRCRLWARNVGVFHSQKAQVQGRYWRTSLKKTQKEIGHMSLQPKKFGQKKCGYNFAKKMGNWESFKEECRKQGRLCEWTIERLQEAYDTVALEDIGRLSGHFEKEHGLLETDHCSTAG